MGEFSPAPFRFGTKAETLARLRGWLSHAMVADQRHFSIAEWRARPTAIVRELAAWLNDVPAAVRSSRLNEDAAEHSMAGAYHSVLNVQPIAAELEAAILAVHNSYGSDIDPADQVLVQPMVSGVSVSGVAFSYDLSSGAPYLTINYDDFSGRTDTVTGGFESKLICIRRGAGRSIRSDRFRHLVETIYEIEHLAGDTPIDIEFCIDREDRIYVLQVRPLVGASAPKPVEQQAFAERIELLKAQVEEAECAPRGVLGARTIFGEMPDWNPAEMIGTTPTPMAASLYHELITERTWSAARAEMGYRDVPYPLMRMFQGHPFIDVRLSLNSFLPATLPDALGAAVVEEQIAYLSSNWHYHDKIEFHVAITAWDFDMTGRLNRLREAGIAENDVERLVESVRVMTRRLLTDPALAPDALLARTGVDFSNSPDAGPEQALAEALDKFELIRQHGTLPFSILARQAFVAQTLLRSLRTVGALSEEDYSAFIQSIESVATDYVRHACELADGERSLETFLHIYGHLRPGTYDLRVPRYDEEPELYLSTHRPRRPKSVNFALSAGNMARIDAMLADAGLGIEAEAFFGFCDRAISGRELAKFRFSRGVSESLKLLTRWGTSEGLSRADIAFMTIEDLRRVHAAGRVDLKIVETISRRKAQQQQHRRIRLPVLIAEPMDCDVVRIPFERPTFVTNGRAAGRVRRLRIDDRHFDIDGAVVVIENADPGYDWVFSHNIQAIITKFGGANSHMAIRCAEFGLPAVIGCGERIFEQVCARSFIEFDCASETITL